MPTNLRNLLAAIGLIVTAGGVSVALWIPNAGVTAQQLIDGAAGDCVRKDVKVVLFGDVCDGGYCRKALDVARCQEVDGGFSVIMPRKYANNFLPAAEFVGAPTASTLPADGEADAPFDCACPRDAACLLSDAGTAFPNGGNRMVAGSFIPSASCVPMPCTLVSGRPFWPASCPGGP